MAKLDNNPLLVSHLDTGTPFVYAHLVKFERPYKIGGVVLDNGELDFSSKYTKFAYITDAGFDITFDDGSTYWDTSTNPPTQNVANGLQTYRANKLIKVGTITESADTKISNISITLDATGLDAALKNETLTFSADRITAVNSFSQAGFREGDVIYLSSSASPRLNNGKSFRITGFRSNGTQVDVQAIDSTFSAESGVTYDVTLASTEITSLKDVDRSINFINRRVYVYKAFFNPEDPSQFIGTPVLMFSGLVTGAEYKEDTNDTPTITWQIKSHWGDFQQVRGRIGSDEFHRALDGKGNANHRGVVRPEYAYDMGFQHANKAVDVLGIYTVMETRYKKKTQTKWGVKQVKLKPYEVAVNKEVDLRFDLSAKYIPVVYGVRRIEGTPVFVDTSATDPSKVYMVESLCEGPIQGILNMYVEDNSLICIDEADYNVRGTGSEAVEIACHGRADRGDVLEGTASQTGSNITSGTVSNVVNGVASYDIPDLFGFNWSAVFATLGLSDPTFNLGSYTGSPVNLTGAQTVGGAGLTHEKGFNITAPMDIKLAVKAGLPNQSAEAGLVSVAKQNTNQGFKLQDDNNINPEEYWGTNHRLLDTAYVAGSYTLTEDQTSLPSLEYVVKGKLIPCYNYDGSFAKDPTRTSADHSSFTLGESVSLYRSSDSTLLFSGVQIIDKWFFFGANGVQEYRFRWSLTAAQEQTLLNTKAFYMNDGTNSWYMVTSDYVVAANLTIQESLKKQVSAASSSGALTLTVSAFTGTGYLSGATGQVSIAITGDDSENSLSYGQTVNYPVGANFPIVANSTTSITLTGSNSAGFNLSNTTYLNITNKVRVSTSASSSNDAYNGMVAKITKFLSDGTRNIIYRNIDDYDGPNRTLTLDYPLATEEIPVSGDTVDIVLADSARDYRPSTNFAIILLDYLMNKRYGAGLTEKELDIDSFLQAARVCDTTSDVTVRVPGASTIVVGDIYRYTSTSFKWQGKVKSYTTNADGTKDVIFTNCIGKLTHKWNNWRSRAVGDVVYMDDSPGLLRSVTSAGVQTTIDTNATTSFTFGLTRTFGTGTTPINLVTNAGNPVVDYSLYDSDFIKYWKYLGWDSQDQRWVTRYQGNLIIDTAEPVFSNIDAILNHFDGTLAFEDGKYALYVETKKDGDADLWWDFKNSTQNWASSAATLTTNDTYMGWDATGVSSYIQKTGISFYGGDQRIVRAKVRRTAGTGWTGRLYYNTDSHGFTTSYYKSISNTTRLNEWTILSWDMSNLTAGGADWTSNYITGLQLQLGSSASDDFDVEWIAVGGGLRIIEAEDIIGGISIKDEGLSKSFNSMSASISDPQNNFNGRSVSFFNSQFLAEDKGVVRSSNFSLDGITNYYNARMAVEQSLKRSRYARTISFMVRPTGMGLTPSDIIKVIYPRFGWDDGKYFRVSSITHREDCLASITAEEYNDNIYFIEAGKKSPYSSDATPDRTVLTPPPPTNLIATNGGSQQLGQITLTWTPIAAQLSGAAFYEIYRNSTPDLGSAQIVTTMPIAAAAYIDVGFSNTVSTNYYYWMRTGINRTVQLASGSLGNRTYYSAYTAMATGSTLVTSAGIIGALTNEVHVESATADGTLTTPLTDAGGYFRLYMGTNELTSNVNYYVGETGTSPVETKSGLRMSIAADGRFALSPNTSWTSTGESFTLRATYSPLNFTVTKVYSISKAIGGTNGTSGSPASLVRVSGQQAFKYVADAQSPDVNSITLTATLTNISPAVYSWQYWTGSIWTNLGGTNTNQTYVLDHNNAAWGSSTSLRVRCISGTLYDEITILKLYDGANTVTGYLTNENHTVAADYLGSPSSFASAGGQFVVYRGTSPVTAAAFSVSPLTQDLGSTVLSRKNGLQFTINKTTGNYTINASPSWSTSQETFEARATYGGVTVTKVYTISKSLAGEPGPEGRYVIVTGPQTFKFVEGSISPEQNTVELTAQLINITPPSYDWEYHNGTGWVNLEGTNTNPTYTLAYNASPWMGRSAIRVRCLTTGGRYDEITITKLYDGVNALTGYLTNENHTIPTDADGLPTGGYSEAGGTFVVYSGSSPVMPTYSLLGGTESPDRWSKVQNELRFSIYKSTGNYTISPATFFVWASDLETFTPQATYRGTTISKVYTISKATAGTPSGSVKITGDQVFRFAPNAISPDVNNITLTATLQNISVANYDWEYHNGTGWVNLEAPNSNSTYTVAYNSSPWLGRNSLRIRCVSNTTFIDEVTLIKVFDGNDPITGYLTNEVHVVPADSTGSPESFTDAGGLFIIYRGTSPAYNPAFTVSPVTQDLGASVLSRKNGLQFTINKTTGAYSLNMSPSWASSRESFEARATYGGTTVSKVYTVSKSRTGATGSPGINGVSGSPARWVRVSGTQMFRFPANAVSPTYNTITLTATLNGGLTLYDWEYYNGASWVNLGGTNTNQTYTLAYNASEWFDDTIRIRCGSLYGGVTYYDEMTIIKVFDGSNNLEGYLTNENFTAPTDYLGSPNLNGANGRFMVYYGGQNVTNSAQFSIIDTGPETVTDGGSYWVNVYQGLAIELNTSPGTRNGEYYIYENPDWTNRAARTATFAATYQGQTVEKIYSISKSIAGSPGTAGTDGAHGTGELLNPSFEQGWLGWTQTIGSQFQIVENALSRTGSWRAQVAGPTISPQLIQNSGVFACEPNETFVLTGYVKAGSPATADVRILARFFDDNDSFVTFKQATFPTTTAAGAWALVRGVITAPNNASRFRVACYVVNDLTYTTSLVAFDDLHVVRVRKDVPDFTWLSTDKVAIQVTDPGLTSTHSFTPQLADRSIYRYQWGVGATIRTQGDVDSFTSSPGTVANQPIIRSYASIMDPDGHPVKTFEFYHLANYQNSAGSRDRKNILSVFKNSYYEPYVGVDGRKVTLDANHEFITSTSTFDPRPSRRVIYLTTATTGTSGTVYYEFLNKTSMVPLQKGTTSSYTYTCSPSDTTTGIWTKYGINLVEVRIREGSNSGPILASDQVMLARLRPDNTPVAILSNPTPTAIIAGNGSVSYTNLTQEIRAAYQDTVGTLQMLTYDSTVSPADTFRVASIQMYGIAGGSPAVTGRYVSNDTRRYRDFVNMVNDIAVVVYNVEMRNGTRVFSTQTLTSIIGKSIVGYDPFPDSDFQVDIGSRLNVSPAQASGAVANTSPIADYRVDAFDTGTYFASAKHDVVVTHTPTNRSALTTVELLATGILTDIENNPVNNYSGVYYSGSLTNFNLDPTFGYGGGGGSK